VASIIYTKDRKDKDGNFATQGVDISVEEAVEHLSNYKFEYKESSPKKDLSPEDRQDLTDFVEFKRVILEIYKDDEKMAPFDKSGFYLFNELSPSTCLKIFPLK